MLRCNFDCFSCPYPDCICPEEMPLSLADQELIEELLAPEDYKRRLREREKAQIHYAAHREKILQRARAYREAHKEERAAYAKAYNKAHRRERAAAQRRWYWENRERILAKERERRKARKELKEDEDLSQ